MATQFKYKNTVIDVKVDTDSNVGCCLCLKCWYGEFSCSLKHVVSFRLSWQISTTITFTEVLPSAKTIASFKVPDYNSGKVWICSSVAGKFFDDYVCGLNIYVCWILYSIYFGSWRCNTSMTMQPSQRLLVWTSLLALMYLLPSVPQALLLVQRQVMILLLVILRSTLLALVWQNQIHLLQ